MSIKQGGNLIAGSGGGVSNIDNLTITENANEEIQTVGVINSRDTSIAVKTWTGTKAQYDAIDTKDPNTLYNITDDTDVSLTILEALYPVGSVYITTANTCPLSTLISGSTWVQETSRILVDKWSSGTEWWELYSDGWCEQGGYVATSSSTTGNLVNLEKPYIDNNYTITIGALGYNSSNTTMFRSICINEKQNSYFRGTTGSGSSLYWHTCGYTSTTTSHKQFRRTN